MSFPRGRSLSLFFLLLLFSVFLVFFFSREKSPVPSRGAWAGGLSAEASSLPDSTFPLAFVENRGQWRSDFRYLAAQGRKTAWFLDKGWVLSLEKKGGEGLPSGVLRGVALRMTFQGASGRGPRGEGRIPSSYNYFLGKDPSRWKCGVPAFSRLRYRELYPGVDLVAGDGGGVLEWDLFLSPGAGTERVAVRCEGIEGLSVGEDGSLRIETALGTLEQTPPRAWVEIPGGGKRMIRAAYRLLGPDTFGFRVEERDPSLAMVIDPGLAWSTFLGGLEDEHEGENWKNTMATDSRGRLYIVGPTRSKDFPTTTGAFQTVYKRYRDAFIAILDPSKKGASQLVWSTLYGGFTGSEEPRGVDVNSNGIVTTGGFTYGTDIPVTPGAFQASRKGGRLEAFVAQFDPSKTGKAQLLYASYLGGTGNDHINDVVVDDKRMITVIGSTDSADFPVTSGVVQPKKGGGLDFLLARLDPSKQGKSSLVWATFLGGKNRDEGMELEISPGGLITVVGDTYASASSPGDFPTTAGAYQTKSGGGGRDAVVARLSPLANLLVFSTFLGGGGVDTGYCLAVSSSGETTVGGTTSSGSAAFPVPPFPTTPGAFQTKYGGGQYDGYVARLGPMGKKLIWSTYIGGPGTSANDEDAVHSLALEPSGAVTLAGKAGKGFPVTPGAYDTTFNGGAGEPTDAFVARLGPMGKRLFYSTYLGGAKEYDRAFGVKLSPLGDALVVGWTNSYDFPTTTGSFQPNLGGKRDGFLAKLDLLPYGVRRYGRSTKACLGEIYMGVTGYPKAGSKGFGLTCNGAPPGAAGLLLMGFSSTGPVPILGIELWINPSLPFFPMAVSSSAAGSTETPLPIPSSVPPGGRLGFQYVWVNRGGCGTGLLSASNALEVTIQ